MKKVFALVMFLAFAAVVGWKVHDKLTTSKVDPRRRGRATVAVEVAPVRRAAIRQIEEFTGTLRPQSQFVIAPKVAGRLIRLVVDVADPVAQGQLIAELDDEEYRRQVDQAQAEVAVAKATVDEALSEVEVTRRELLRAEGLHAKGIVTESELDRAVAQHQAAQAKHKLALALVSQKDAATKAAEVRQSYTQIHAAWHDGQGARVVGERFVDEGAMLKANDAIVSVLDIAVLKAVVHVTEPDYPKLHPEQEVVVTTDAFPTRTFAGRITRVAPLLKETSRQASIEIEVPNADTALKPGMYIGAEVELDRRADATVVPFSALVRRRDRQGVFVADREALKVRFLPVTVGIVDGDLAEVTDAPELLEGAWVVTLGQHLLEDGAAISLPEEAPPAAGAGPPPPDGSPPPDGAPRR